MASRVKSKNIPKPRPNFYYFVFLSKLGDTPPPSGGERTMASVIKRGKIMKKGKRKGGGEGQKERNMKNKG
jgi:hypothetical protein